MLGSRLGQTGNCLGMPVERRCRPSEAAGKYLKRLERVKGIEPSSSAWEAVALPLSYTRLGLFH
jgi:hypothetical protein